jgi:hypothetical protein
MSIPDTRFLSNPDFLIGDGKVINVEANKVPCSTLALKAWLSIKDKFLCYRRSDGKIWADWEKPKDKDLVDGSEEVRTYVKALAELPSLVLQYFREKGIKTNISTVNQRRVCKKFQTTYQIISQWLEFLLLHNQEILLELRSTSKKYLERIAKRSASLYRLIQEIWSRAVVQQDDSCQWVLHYDSPAQLLFDVEACWCVADMLCTMKSGYENTAISKEQYYTDVRSIKEALLKNSNSFTLQIVGDKAIETISPDSAIHLTVAQVRRQGSSRVPEKYQRYLDAWNSEASYRQRTKELKHIYMNAKGELVTGEQGKQVKRKRNRKQKKT